ncbi:NCA2-domain-containing protein, partial [Aureobasidium melanogenum]
MIDACSSSKQYTLRFRFLYQVFPRCKHNLDHVIVQKGILDRRMVSPVSCWHARLSSSSSQLGCPRLLVPRSTAWPASPLYRYDKRGLISGKSLAFYGYRREYVFRCRHLLVCQRLSQSCVRLSLHREWKGHSTLRQALAHAEAGTSGLNAPPPVGPINITGDDQHFPSDRAEHLQSLVKSLSITPSSRNPLLSASQIHHYLTRAQLSLPDEGEDLSTQKHDGEYEQELAWLLVAKATVQLLLRMMSGIGINIQTAPFRLAEWSHYIWADVRRRSADFNIRDAGAEAQQSLTARWSEFYGLVKEVVREKSVKEMRKRVVSPVARIRGSVRQKQNELKRCRLRGANALGHAMLLLWMLSLPRSMKKSLLLISLTQPLQQPPTTIHYTTLKSTPKNMEKLLNWEIPEYTQQSKVMVQKHGKPSRIVRYWFPITVGILSSSTILRYLVNRKAEILTWIQEFGHTIRDFWINWCVEPTRKVIQTIRHDKDSEVSIMSKRSLEGDRASLERMVVDFAVDNPGNATESGSPLTEAEIASIRAKVREGDLTPVLKAYEKDLSSPFMGTIRGNLIRALLIQVQKTKVDVEVAMGGIDALLKSQELVFGFVGLTPGILVTIGISRWVSSAFTSRRGADASRKQGHMMRQLRNIDRVLTNSTPTEKFGELYYKDHGLLLCEVHVLREAAYRVMPAQVFRDFVEDVEELVDVRTGIKKQRKVVNRIRWAQKQYLVSVGVCVDGEVGVVAGLVGTLGRRRLIEGGGGTLANGNFWASALTLDVVVVVAHPPYKLLSVYTPTLRLCPHESRRRRLFSLLICLLHHIYVGSCDSRSTTKDKHTPPSTHSAHRRELFCEFAAFR